MVRERVVHAWDRQLSRQGTANRLLDAPSLRQYAIIKDDDRRLLEAAMQRFSISARAAHRILRVARTIADLDGCPAIATAHLAESIQLRCPSERSS